MNIDWQGQSLELLADRAIWWRERRTVFVADVHFGKGDAFRRMGMPVPMATTAADCGRLVRLLRGRDASRLAVLGDLFHSASGMTASLVESLKEWRKSIADVRIDVVPGNHDAHVGDHWEELAIHCHDEPWDLCGLTCRHHPDDGGPPHLCGHLHPGVAVRGLGRRPCFHRTRNRFTLPAFGEFTGMAMVAPAADDLVVAVADGELVAVPHALVG